MLNKKSNEINECNITLNNKNNTDETVKLLLK